MINEESLAIARIEKIETTATPIGDTGGQNSTFHESNPTALWEQS